MAQEDARKYTSTSEALCIGGTLPAGSFCLWVLRGFQSGGGWCALASGLTHTLATASGDALFLGIDVVPESLFSVWIIHFDIRLISRFRYQIAFCKSCTSVKEFFKPALAMYLTALPLQKFICSVSSITSTGYAV
jgi:hypothetical protein